MTEVLIPRLRQFVDPFYSLGVRPFTLEDARRAPAQGFIEHDRSIGYHVGRVRTIVDKIEAGWTMDPIWVDNECAGSAILPTPIIDDGHHRFIAAGLLGWERIKVEYGGRLDVLEYLTGESDQIPW